MQKVVINSCYGGFGLSLKGSKRYLELNNKEMYVYYQENYKQSKYERVNDWENSKYSSFNIVISTKDLGEITNKIPNGCSFYAGFAIENRDDKALVQVVEELGKEANGEHANLRVVEIPDGVNWEIEEYDGYEHVAECHRTWG